MIQKLYDAGYFSSLDYHMAMTAGRVAGEADPLVLLAMATASRFTSQGHVCVDLLKLSKTPIEPDSGEGVEGAIWPDAEKWILALRKSVLVSDDEPHAPLVLDTAGRLYLARYWQYQQRLVSQLRERSVLLAEGLDERLLKRGLNHLFPEEPNRADAQRLAAETSVRRCLTVVSGGPGTGKTHTVVKMLLLIIDQALAAGKKNLRIELSAPHGKGRSPFKGIDFSGRRESCKASGYGEHPIVPDTRGDHHDSSPAGKASLNLRVSVSCGESAAGGCAGGG